MRVNPHLFKIPASERPKLPPELSAESRAWWVEQRRKCIEGEWIAGRWMPGNLYFYINFWPIRMAKTKFAKTKGMGLPELYDIFWEVSYLWNEARGFAGFEKQPEVAKLEEIMLKIEFLSESADENAVHEIRKLEAQMEQLQLSLPKPQNTLWNTTESLGRPLYLNEAQNMMWLGNRGHGKDLHEDTVVYYEDGPKAIKHVQLGDQIYDEEGNLTTVISRKDFTDQMQYRITFADGRTITCGGGHLWTVIDSNGRRKTLDTDTLRRNYLYGKRQDSNYFVQMQKAINYPYKELPLDPYTVGLLIGDGGLTGSATVFTTADKELLQHIPYEITKYKQQYAYGIKNITQQTRELGLRKSSLDKHIPKEYLLASIEQRFALLQGLMDTDGSINKDGKIEFSTSSPQLAADMETLLQGLGIRNKTTKRTTAHADSYRIHIITSEPIFRLQRKLERLNTQPSAFAKANREKVAIRKIEELAVAPSVCIGVSNPSCLFQAGPNIVTHNSFYMAGAVIAHEFLFDGQKRYTPTSAIDTASEVVVAAGDSKYSTDTLGKVQFGFDNLYGAVNLYGVDYPSPLMRKYAGSLTADNSNVYQRYRVKDRLGNWRVRGTGSVIKHRSFKNNPFAANGTRASVQCLEEVGMFENLMRSWLASQDTMTDGDYKFGSALATGTGGDMDSGTIDASQMYYQPEQFQMVSILDTYEGRGRIGYFVPATKGKRHYKDNWGYTDMEKAIKSEEKQINKRKRGASGSAALDAYLQNQPQKPSHMFLTKKGNIFPVAELMDHLAELQRGHKFHKLELPVQLKYDKDSPQGVSEEIDYEGKLEPINHFPTPDNIRNRDGCIVIYEKPITVGGVVPHGLYILGHDPYASDDARGESHGATYVLKTGAYAGKYGHDEIVAEYVGRPESGREELNENILKLAMYYGATPRMVNFENNRGNVKEFFEKKKKLHLLATQPETLLSKHATKQGGTIIYGTTVGNKQVKLELCRYFRDWLLEDRGTDQEGKPIKNLNLIPSQALVQELIRFDLNNGNFDRVMAMLQVTAKLVEDYNQYEKRMRKQPSTSITDEILDTMSTLNKRKGWDNVTHNERAFTKTKAVVHSQE